METVTSCWQDYEIIDAGNRDKLERWKDVILVRPDPQAIWQPTDDRRWQRYDGIYHRSDKGGGSWQFNRKLPEYWTISYRDLVFKVTPTNFKHTGLFPEQATNWDWLAELIRNAGRDIRVLNLFGYTGAATISASAAGAREVVHLDAAKGMVAWAKENMALNHLEDHVIRFIVDDAMKFVKREQRRQSYYDVIIMDPPSYGRGPNGEVWKLEDKLEELISESIRLLNDQPLAFLVNCYTTGFSAIALDNILKKHLLSRFPDGKINTVELTLPISDSRMLLPCGISGRFQR
ncbi:MAG: class I SAM-dependent methyltransferase [Erysipelotrichaceae bacterium]|nr:class I SAM-dependent methyltransferase [Erysipelotrichaceae bacterium]MBR5048930.1 class I SAM-dependent methyltransferase [Erysipelotrichaceae bacterium]